MSNIGSILKSEIARLARREIKAQVEPLRKASASHRRDIAALKREIANLQRQLAASRRAVKPSQSESPSESKTVRFSANGLKSHRAKLGLSASDYGRLVDVTGQSIYAWESGKTAPRQVQAMKLASLRAVGRREALRRLEGLSK